MEGGRTGDRQVWGKKAKQHQILLDTIDFSWKGPLRRTVAALRSGGFGLGDGRLRREQFPARPSSATRPGDPEPICRT